MKTYKYSLAKPQELWVADIQDQYILGLDFLYPNCCQVNLHDQVLSMRFP